MNNLRILVTGAGAIVAPSIIKNYKCHSILCKKKVLLN